MKIQTTTAKIGNGTKKKRTRRQEERKKVKQKDRHKMLFIHKHKEQIRHTKGPTCNSDTLLALSMTLMLMFKCFNLLSIYINSNNFV